MGRPGEQIDHREGSYRNDADRDDGEHSAPRETFAETVDAAAGDTFYPRAAEVVAELIGGRRGEQGACQGIEGAKGRFIDKRGDQDEQGDRNGDEASQDKPRGEQDRAPRSVESGRYGLGQDLWLKPGTEVGPAPGSRQGDQHEHQARAQPEPAARVGHGTAPDYRIAHVGDTQRPVRVDQAVVWQLPLPLGIGLGGERRQAPAARAQRLDRGDETTLPFFGIRHAFRIQV